MLPPDRGDDPRPAADAALRSTVASDHAPLRAKTDAGTPGAALRSTVASDRAPLTATTDAGPSGSGTGFTPQRDLVAAVIYYRSLRELFGDAATPPQLGKYSLERVLGSGAFGSVFLGHNPDTEGEVAVKVLHAHGRHSGEREMQRLEREAQALAQIAHPNVVPVYDAGIADGARYIVMRRVSGVTLRQAQSGKPWRTIVDLYVAAARGLAAVHAAGLVHRDFKADNVLVGDDGQVMLADFGLVCLFEGPGERPPTAPPAATASALAASLTRTGEVFGTPAYMAPEAIENVPLGPRSDLYSLAVSLFEALYDALPFAGDTLLALYLAATQEGPRPRPAASAVPLWLDVVLREALRADPSQRPGSVDALITALDFRARERADAERQASKIRRKRFGIGLGAAALTGLALGFAAMRPEDRCAAPEARIAAAWPERREALAEDVHGLDSPVGASTWARVRDLLDAHVGDWATTFGATCRATFHDGVQSAELFDARVACLDQRRRELGALVDGLRPVSEATLVRALEAAARLDSPVACATATRTPSPSAAQRSALEPVLDAFAAARVHELTGDYVAAAQRSAAAVALARDVGFAPAIAAALIADGRHRWLVHDGPAAQAALTEALDLAEAAALDELAADASNLLTKIAALELAEADRGDEWARQTQRKLVRIAADPWRRAELFNNRGLLAFHLAGDAGAALGLHRQALDLRLQLPGEARLLIADSRQNLGNALAAGGRVTEALGQYAESQRLNREVLGEAHPRVFDEAFNAAVTFYDTGEYTRATLLAEEALAGYLRVSGAASGDVADVHVLLSAILELRGQLPAGLAHARLAAQILADDPTANLGRRAIAVERVGSLERESGDPEAALLAYDRALEILADDPGFTAERVAVLVDRATTLTVLKRLSEARHDCERAVAIAGAGAPALARYRAAALRVCGLVHLAEHRHVDARRALEEALALLVHTPDPPANAEVKFLLAQALVADDRPRALTLAGEALGFYRTVNHEELIKEIVTWIDANQANPQP